LHRHADLDTVTGLLTRSADTLGIIAGAVVVLAVLWTRRRWTEMGVLVTALAVELSAFLAVNALIGRDRPAVVRLGSTPSTSSFPSGHTAATLVLYGAVALFVSATARAVVWRALAWLAAVVMPLLVGFARVYRGFHHPTDVFFGLVLGFAALLVAVLAARRWAPAGDRAEVRR
jgi:undecaprenyl-diphosphatase